MSRILSLLKAEELFTVQYNADQPQKPIFSGQRVKRGLYQTKDGDLINADVNGALNILRKSNVVSLTALHSSGDVATPKRIKIA